MIKHVLTYKLQAEVAPSVALQKDLKLGAHAYLQLHLLEPPDPPTERELVSLVIDLEYNAIPETLQFCRRLPFDDWMRISKKALRQHMVAEGYALEGQVDTHQQSSQQN